jgi:3-oxoacyl-[acyl-carrier protein] reductase
MTKPSAEGLVVPTGEISLAGKVVLVTGASTGIGRATAQACAEAGADLAITYVSDEAGATSSAGRIRALGRRVEVFRVDLADAAAVTALAERARAALGRVDVWINNAGADILTEAAHLSWTEKLDRLLSVDLRGTVLASWAAVELMRGQEHGGVILNTAWDHVVAGGMTGQYAQVFCAAKGGVYSFSRVLARTVAPHIRVNVLAPGWVETEYGETLDPAVKQRITTGIPLQRWARPEEVAAAAVFLASDRAAYITGQMLMINGGDVI